MVEVGFDLSVEGLQLLRRGTLGVSPVVRFIQLDKNLFELYPHLGNQGIMIRVHFPNSIRLTVNDGVLTFVIGDYIVKDSMIDIVPSWGEPIGRSLVFIRDQFSRRLAEEGIHGERVGAIECVQEKTTVVGLWVRKSVQIVCASTPNHVADLCFMVFTGMQASVPVPERQLKFTVVGEQSGYAVIVPRLTILEINPIMGGINTVDD